MGRHSLQERNISHQYFAATAIIDREYHVNNRPLEQLPSERDVLQPTELGAVTIEIFNNIVQNFESEKPRLKTRLKKAGKTVISLLKSIRFEYAQPASKKSKLEEIYDMPIEDIDDAITSVWANEQDGIPYDQQTEYLRLLKYEDHNLTADLGEVEQPRIHLLTHDRSVATEPHPQFVAKVAEMMRVRAKADQRLATIAGRPDWIAQTGNYNTPNL
ncbi:MAG TPA: hypothetical protein VFZ58_01795 [Candidatus Saccharimonadales bacterium]